MQVPQGNISVLILEDDEYLATQWKSKLEEKGYIVAVVDTYEDAEKAINSIDDNCRVAICNVHLRNPGLQFGGPDTEDEKRWLDVVEPLRLRGITVIVPTAQSFQGYKSRFWRALDDLGIEDQLRVDKTGLRAKKEVLELAEMILKISSRPVTQSPIAASAVSQGESININRLDSGLYCPPEWDLLVEVAVSMLAPFTTFLPERRDPWPFDNMLTEGIRSNLGRVWHQLRQSHQYIPPAKLGPVLDTWDRFNKAEHPHHPATLDLVKGNFKNAFQGREDPQLRKCVEEILLEKWSLKTGNKWMVYLSNEHYFTTDHLHRICANILLEGVEDMFRTQKRLEIATTVLNEALTTNMHICLFAHMIACQPQTMYQ